MDGFLVLGIALALLLGLFAAGVPVFLAFLALNTLGVAVFLGPQAFGMVANSLFTTTPTSSLTAIALFVLMGAVLFRSGSSEVLFDAVDRFVGRLRGRQFVLTGVLSAVFGALSGSNMAVAAMMVKTVFPDMERRGHDRKLSIGMIPGGASLAPVIPPSVLVISIATLANVSVAGLLVAGVLGAMATAAVFGRLRIAMLKEALRGSVLITAMVLVIMASSILFSQLLALSGASGQLTEWVTQLGWHPVWMLLVMMGLVFVFCRFIDQVAVMLVVIPIYLPLVEVLGFDPLWFWLLMLLNVTVGGITPPFGYAIFASRGARNDGSMSERFSASWPFVGLFLRGMLIIGFFPALATWLPAQL